MLGFSLVFYAWAGIRYLPLLLGMTLICWVSAQLIEKSETAAKRKLFLIVCIFLDLSILGVFKYATFFFENLNALTGVPEVIPQIVLPVGISFYTFQLISYVVDVYRGETRAQSKYWMLLLYASLFHQCIAGPIVRYTDISRDIMTRRVRAGELSRGMSRFAVGLAKKAVLANGCAAVADSLLAAQGIPSASVTAIWLGNFMFMLQIYLDFSAYSDMAIGMGLMCGLHYKENFNYPYMSDSVTDFWRRWHISLSSFFRDYVYIPLGGNRCSDRRQMFNLLVVWFLTGLWHGASWNYIIWGLYYFVLLLIEKFIWQGRDRLHPALKHLTALVAVYLGWIIFKFEDLSLLTYALKGMFGLNHNPFNDASVSLAFKNNIFFILFAVIAVTPAGKYLSRILKNISRENKAVLWIYGVADALIPVALLILSMTALVGNSYNPFLYFQF